MSSELYVRETFLNADEGYIFGDSGGVQPSYHTSRGDLYRSCVAEYGRCTGKVFIDAEDGAKAIGWVFIGRQRYEDTGEPYLREVWVEVHTAPPTVATEYHYAEARP